MNQFYAAGILLFSINASAAFLVEPYAGYQVGVTSLSINQSGVKASAKLDTPGGVFGFRVGGTLSRGFLAFDYAAGTTSPTVKETSSNVQSLSVSGSSARASLGVTAGIDLNFLRPYAGYIFSDAMSLDDIYIGTGLKAGVGLGLHRKVRLNLEYQTATYTKVRSSSGVERELEGRSGFDAVSVAGVFANLSFPFDF